MVNFSNEHILTPRIVNIIFTCSLGSLESFTVSLKNLMTIVLVLIFEVSLPAIYFIIYREILFLDHFWLSGYRPRLRCSGIQYV